MTPATAQIIPAKLIGSIQVQPATARPGESVFIQVLDTSGKPYTEDSDVIVTIDGIQSPARYYQYNQPGSRIVTVCALQGTTREVETATVQVAGTPLAFRLTPLPLPTAMPVIQVSQNFATPYVASFSLATPASVRRILAAKNNATVTESTPTVQPATPTAQKAAVASPALETKVAAAQTAAFNLTDEIARVASTTANVKAATPSTATAANGTKLSVVSLAAEAVSLARIAPPAGIGYKWDFGDGQTVTTTSPNVTHDYFPAIKAHLIAHSFHVKCTILHDNLAITRTLVLHSAYGICKSTGIVVPYVTGDIYATFQKGAFSASLVAHNPEPDATVTLTQMAIVPASTDSGAALPAPKFTAMSTPITIKPSSASAIGVYVTAAELGALGPNVAGFSVYYSGELTEDPLIPIKMPLAASRTLAVAATSPTASSVTIPRPLPASAKTPVRFSWYFRIRRTDAGMNTLHLIPLAIDQAKLVTAAQPVGPATVDAATKTAAIALPNALSTATLAQAAKAIQSAPALEDFKSPPTPSPTAQAGAICDPDNISDAQAAQAASMHLACQLTNQTEEVEMPGSFQNAQMGDAILTPGGNSPISQLLRGLTPPQHYSHSGMVTQNFVEITHCTASSDRYGDYTTGIGGAGGIQPDVLQYGWPGSITQTVDNAINGQNMKDPAGKVYNVGGFDADPDPEFSMIPPLIVKPLPENEEAARPILRKIAATARSKGAQIDSQGNVTIQKGACYYSFYGYTNPQIGINFGDPAPASAGWAQGLTPGVCSAFVWLCAKENGVNLLGPSQFENPSELSPTAVAEGAAVSTNTLDGLFFYSQQERQQAAQVLYGIFQNEILDKEGIFQYIPFLGTDIANNIADQLMNVFAFGNPNMYGSSAWQTPGDANAVSPDNITWWNPPLFGYAEPAQYLQPHTEQYTVSKWTTYSTSGSIAGIVTLNGQPVQGVEVQVYDGKSAVTGGDGKYSITDIPVGSYQLKASVVKNGIEYENGATGQAVQLTTSKPDINVNISLATLPDVYRDVVVVCQVTSCDHGDANIFHTHGVQSGPTNTFHVRLGPGQVAGSCTYSFNYDGGGYFTCAYKFNCTLAEDLSIEVTLVASITDDGDSNPSNSYTMNFNVGKDGGWSGYINNLESTGFSYHNGPANFTFSVANNQETT